MLPALLQNTVLELWNCLSTELSTQTVALMLAKMGIHDRPKGERFHYIYTFIFRRHHDMLLGLIFYHLPSTPQRSTKCPCNFLAHIPKQLLNKLYHYYNSGETFVACNTSGNKASLFKIIDLLDAHVHHQASITWLTFPSGVSLIMWSICIANAYW